jgi:preprotein translocase subunit SecY
MHLCFWGGIWLAFIGVYTYILSYIPFIQQATQSTGSIPVIVSGAWVIIIVGVVQELINKINAELLMERYDRI